MFGESFDGGFRCVVGWVARGVGDALFRAGDDYCGWVIRGGGGLDGGEEGAYSVYDAEEIGADDFLEVVGLRPSAAEAGAGVEG
jgi:hypothetical protein